jgi:hypothetical protein
MGGARPAGWRIGIRGCGPAQHEAPSATTEGLVSSCRTAALSILVRALWGDDVDGSYLVGEFPGRQSLAEPACQVVDRGAGRAGGQDDEGADALTEQGIG